MNNKKKTFKQQQKILTKRNYTKENKTLVHVISKTVSNSLKEETRRSRRSMKLNIKNYRIIVKYPKI